MAPAGRLGDFVQVRRHKRRRRNSEDAEIGFLEFGDHVISHELGHLTAIGIILLRAVPTEMVRRVGDQDHHGLRFRPEGKAAGNDQRVERVLRDIAPTSGLQGTHPTLELAGAAGEDGVLTDDVILERHQAEPVVAVGLGQPVSKIDGCLFQAIDERPHTFGDVEYYHNVYRPALLFTTEVNNLDLLPVFLHLHMLGTELPNRLPAQVGRAEVEPHRAAVAEVL